MLNWIQGCRGFGVFFFPFLYCISVSAFFTSRTLAFTDPQEIGGSGSFVSSPFIHSAVRTAILIRLPVRLPENTKNSFLYIFSPFSPHRFYSCPLSVLHYCFPFDSHLVLVLQVTIYLMFTISLHVDVSLLGLVVWSLFSRRILRNSPWKQYFLSS